MDFLYEKAFDVLAPEVLQLIKKVLSLSEWQEFVRRLKRSASRVCREYRKVSRRSEIASDPADVWQTVLSCLEAGRVLSPEDFRRGDERVEDSDRQRFFQLLTGELNRNGKWFLQNKLSLLEQMASEHGARNDAQHQALMQRVNAIAGMLSKEQDQPPTAWKPQWLRWDSAQLRHNHGLIGHDPEDREDIVSVICEKVASQYPFASGLAYCVTGEGGIGKTEVCREVLKRTLISHPTLRALYVDVAGVKSAAALMGQIHAALGRLTAEQSGDVIPFLVEAALKDGLLLYMDNFEDAAWSADGAQAWQLAERLSRIDGCAVLLSSTAVPESIPHIAVTELKLEAAEQMYLSEYKRIHGGNADLDSRELALVTRFLEEELEGHPLSIVMMAAQTYFFSLQESMQRWRNLKGMDDPGYGVRKSLYRSMLLTYNAMREKGWQEAISLWALHAAWQTRATEASYRIAGISQEARAKLMMIGVLRRDGATYRVLMPLQTFMLQFYPDEAPEQWKTLLEGVVRAYLTEQKTIAGGLHRKERLRAMHDEYVHLIHVWDAYWQWSGKDMQTFESILNEAAEVVPAVFAGYFDRKLQLLMKHFDDPDIHALIANARRVLAYRAEAAKAPEAAAKEAGGFPA